MGLEVLFSLLSRRARFEKCHFAYSLVHYTMIFAIIKTPFPDNQSKESGISAFSLLDLLGVQAAIGVGSLLNAGSNANTVLVASRVRNSSGCPDRPSSIDAVGAGNQIVASELQVLVLDGPSLALGVLRGRLGTSGISNLSLACGGD